MTNYEFLKEHIEDKKAVADILCSMVQMKAKSEEWCCDDCPFLEDCGIAQNGFKKWLDDKHTTPLADWGKYGKN